MCTALLAAVSHDLRSPLASPGLGGLAAQHRASAPAAAQAELLATADDSLTG